MANVKNKLYSYRNGMYTFEKVNEMVDNDTSTWLAKAGEYRTKLDQIQKEEEEKAQDVELDDLARQIIKLVETQKLITELNFETLDIKHAKGKKEVLNLEDFPELIAGIDKNAKTWDNLLEHEEDLIETLIQSNSEPQIKLQFVEFEKVINAKFSNKVSQCIKDLNTARENKNKSSEDESGLV